MENDESEKDDDIITGLEYTLFNHSLLTSNQEHKDLWTSWFKLLNAFSKLSDEEAFNFAIIFNHIDQHLLKYYYKKLVEKNKIKIHYIPRENYDLSDDVVEFGDSIYEPIVCVSKTNGENVQVLYFIIYNDRLKEKQANWIKMSEFKMKEMLFFQDGEISADRPSVVTPESAMRSVRLGIIYATLHAMTHGLCLIMYRNGYYNHQQEYLRILRKLVINQII